MKNRDFYIKDKDILDARISALYRRLNKARNAIFGGNVSLLPLITDNNGRLSKERPIN